MFARVFALLPLVVLASAANLDARNSENICNARDTHCCAQTMDAAQAVKSKSFLNILDALGGLSGSAIVGADCTSLLGTVCAAGSTCCSGDAVTSGFSLINTDCDTLQG